MKFLEVRKQVHAVYEARKADFDALEKKSQSASDKMTPGDLWSAGGQLADLFGALKLAQAKALAEAGMSEAEYTTSSSPSTRRPGPRTPSRRRARHPAETLEKTMAEAGRQVEDAMSRGVAEAQKQKVPGADGD